MERVLKACRLKDIPSLLMPKCFGCALLETNTVEVDSFGRCSHARGLANRGKQGKSTTATLSVPDVANSRIHSSLIICIRQRQIIFELFGNPASERTHTYPAVKPVELSRGAEGNGYRRCTELPNSPRRQRRPSQLSRRVSTPTDGGSHPSQFKGGIPETALVQLFQLRKS